MKIYIAQQSKQTIGGGWSFLRNFQKYARRKGIQFVNKVEDCDIYFIAGATMVTRPEVEYAKKIGKKIVLRIDNIPRNSRNRNTGTSRLYDFAQLADLVVYQSQWAKDYIKPFLKRDGVVIINGVDTEIFKLTGSVQPKDGKPQYLYTRFNRDETKQWHQAWYDYILKQRQEKDAHLWLVGQFSPEMIDYNFDFFQGERFEYKGVMESPEDMAEYYRGADYLLMPYFNDACPNTMIEALLCGCKVLHNSTGGTIEIEEQFKADPKGLSAETMVDKYISELAKL